MSIPGNSIKAVSGFNPMLVRGVSRLHTRANFRSQPMFSDKAYKITGVTRDSSGNPLPGCVVDLFYTIDDTKAGSTTSDANGAYSFSVGPNLSCYIVAYLVGAPDVAGTTVNTLIAS